MNNKKVLITFLGNIAYDTRCNNLFNTLISKGYDVEFIGFDWLTENFSAVKGKKTVYKLSKKTLSIFFYLKFYSILKLKLLTRKYDIIFAEDLYCLPACVIAGKIKGAKVIYDCRELFGFLAGLKNKKFVQKLWSISEKIFISKADLVITTGEMDSEFIRKNYSIRQDIVLRNLPLYKKPDSIVNYYELLGIEKSKKVLIYQGVIVHGRGLKMIFELLQITNEFVLVILGSGEMINYYKNLSAEMNLSDKVFFVGKIPQDELLKYTAGGFAGLSLIENVSLSYYYALPNKLFEYIMAEIPVITTKLPQMEKVIDEFQVGYSVNENDIKGLKEVLIKLSNDEALYKQLKSNCKKASEILNWNKEFDMLASKLIDLK